MPRQVPTCNSSSQLQRVHDLSPAVEVLGWSAACQTTVERRAVRGGRLFRTALSTIPFVLMQVLGMREVFLKSEAPFPQNALARPLGLSEQVTGWCWSLGFANAPIAQEVEVTQPVLTIVRQHYEVLVTTVTPSQSVSQTQLTLTDLLYLVHRS